jgi:flagellar motor switch protein FliM
MSTILGNTTLSLKNFKNLTEGDLLYFKKPDQATVYINDIPTFKADVGSQGPNSAVKIKEFINPENGKDLEGIKDE